MREAARETYEKYFSMEAFSGRLEEMICETKREWRNESPVSLRLQSCAILKRGSLHT